MSIGKNIRQLRKQNNLTQEDLAKKLFVTRNAVSKWETDKGMPGMDNLKALSKLFDVTFDELFSDGEIIEITLENRENTLMVKNLLLSFLLFLAFAGIGTLIPYYSFAADPTSGIAVFAIFLPLSYIILGLFSGILSIRWPYVLIASGLALIPITMFFEMVMRTVILGYWGVIYYGLFIASYLLLNKVARKSVRRMDVGKLCRIFKWIALAATLLFVAHTSVVVVNLHRNGTSFSWYTAVLINALSYAVPLAIIYVLFIYYHFQNRRRPDCR